MFATEILKVLARNEEDFGVLQCRRRGGIIAAVEDGQLREGATRTFPSEDLLAT
jgi:hypothetical protein